MHVAHVGRGRRQSGTDRPDRLIGNDDVLGIIGQRAGKLGTDDLLRLSGIAVGARLADTDDGEKAGTPRRERFGADLRIGLMMIMPALGMADDDGGRLCASASISAAMSPVCAPDGSAWQSCPPMPTRLPRARAAKSAISRNGGQTRMSTWAGSLAAPATILSSLDAEPRRARSSSNCRRPADDAPCCTQNVLPKPYARICMVMRR